MAAQKTETPSRAPSPAGKAIVYAAGGLTELYPLTAVVPKGLLPVFDKPLVYYSLSVLMLAGIRQIALVCTSGDRAAFERLLGDGRQFGFEIKYLTQDAALGPADALITARDFIGNGAVAMILADCVVYGDGLQRVLSETMQDRGGATIFAHPVSDPERHTVVALDEAGRPREIEDQPPNPPSNLAVTGIFFFDAQVVDVARQLASAKRGGLRLSDIHLHYLAHGDLAVRTFGRGFAWLDTNTHAALNAATNFIETIESTHGLKIACLEEIAFQKGWMTRDQLTAAGARMNNGYGAYLQKIAAAGSSA